MAKRTVVVPAPAPPAPPAPRPAPPPLLAPDHIVRDASGRVVEYERGGLLPAGGTHAVTAAAVLAPRDFATIEDLMAEYHRQAQALSTAAQDEITEAQQAAAGSVAPAARTRGERMVEAIKLRDTTARQLKREERDELARVQRETRMKFASIRKAVADAFTAERDAAYADERLVLTGAESGLRDVLAIVQRRLADEQGKLEAWLRVEQAKLKAKVTAEPLPLVEAPLAEPVP